MSDKRHPRCASLNRTNILILLPLLLLILVSFRNPATAQADSRIVEKTITIEHLATNDVSQLPSEKQFSVSSDTGVNAVERASLKMTNVSWAVTKADAYGIPTEYSATVTFSGIENFVQESAPEKAQPVTVATLTPEPTSHTALVTEEQPTNTNDSESSLQEESEVPEEIIDEALETISECSPEKEPLPPTSATQTAAVVATSKPDKVVKLIEPDLQDEPAEKEIKSNSENIEDTLLSTKKKNNHSNLFGLLAAGLVIILGGVSVKNGQKKVAIPVSLTALGVLALVAMPLSAQAQEQYPSYKIFHDSTISLDDWELSHLRDEEENEAYHLNSELPIPGKSQGNVYYDKDTTTSNILTKISYLGYPNTNKIEGTRLSNDKAYVVTLHAMWIGLGQLTKADIIKYGNITSSEGLELMELSEKLASHASSSVDFELKKLATNKRSSGTTNELVGPYIIHSDIGNTENDTHFKLAPENNSLDLYNEEGYLATSVDPEVPFYIGTHDSKDLNSEATFSLVADFSSSFIPTVLTPADNITPVLCMIPNTTHKKTQVRLNSDAHFSCSTIRIQDGITGENLTEAVYTLTPSKGTEEEPVELSFDKNKGVWKGYIAPGSYRLSAKSIPEGYMSENEAGFFQTEFSTSTGQQNITVHLYKKMPLTLTFKDSQSYLPLKEGKYQLDKVGNFESNGKVKVGKTFLHDLVPSSDFGLFDDYYTTPISEYSADNSGSIQISGLTFGLYKLTQLESAQNHKLMDTLYFALDDTMYMPKFTLNTLIDKSADKDSDSNDSVDKNHKENPDTANNSSSDNNSGEKNKSSESTQETHTEKKGVTNRKTDKTPLTCEVDIDSISLTSAPLKTDNANNLNTELIAFNLDFRSTSETGADAFTVTDNLICVQEKGLRIQKVVTGASWGDKDGKMRVEYRTDGSWKTWAKDLSTTNRTSLDVADLSLPEDVPITGLRYVYGEVDKGFTTRNYRGTTLNENDSYDWSPKSHNPYYTADSALARDLSPITYLASCSQPLSASNVISDTVTAQITGDNGAKGMDSDTLEIQVADTSFPEGENISSTSQVISKDVNTPKKYGNGIPKTGDTITKPATKAVSAMVAGVGFILISLGRFFRRQS